MKRVCPNCNKNLKEDEGYFCLACGSKLDDHMVRHTTTFSPRKIKFIPSRKDKFKMEFNLKTANKNVVMALGVLGGFILLSVLGVGLASLINYLQMRKETTTEQAQQRVDYANTIDLSLEQPNFVFGANEITRFIPVEADFYIEGQDFNKLTNKLYGEGSTSILKERFGVVLSGKYAIFGRKVDSAWRYALIGLATEDELRQIIEFNANKMSAEEDLIEADGTSEETAVTTDETLDAVLEIEAEDEDILSFEVIENAVVITNYKDFVKEIKQSASGLTKNVTHNQKYSSYAAFLPPDGQFIFMDFRENFNETYQFFKSFNPSDEADKMLEEVVAKEYSKFVLRNNE